LRKNSKKEAKYQKSIRVEVCDLLARSKNLHRDRMLLQQTFNALVDFVREDAAGIRRFKAQKAQTLDAVQTMHHMSTEARLTAEKVRISQDHMLTRMMNLVKTNRANSQRKNLI